MIKMGHLQPPTPIYVDNTTEVGFTNGTIKQKNRKQSTCITTEYRTKISNGSYTSTGAQDV